MTDYRALLHALHGAEVRYVLVGGLAAIVHGAARLTQDVDVVYDRAPDNLERLVRALAPHEPYLRGAPPGLPFAWEATTLRRGLNFTLTTALGDIDLLGEILGGGRYASVIEHADLFEVFDLRCPVIGLEALIATKRAAGRPKDLESIAELEALIEERDEG